MPRLTDNTTLADLLDPVSRALARVRHAAVGRTLTKPDFTPWRYCASCQGCRRMPTWREQAQTLVKEAHPVLPDRLDGIPGLGGPPVWAIDDTYQAESAHCRRRTPEQGGKDHPKGHAWLSFYNQRIGVPEDVWVDTRNRHATRILREYGQELQALTREHWGLWLVDRAFIDSTFWDPKHRSPWMTMITRMTSNLGVALTEGMPLTNFPANEAVVQDLRITLTNTRDEWRVKQDKRQIAKWDDTDGTDRLYWTAPLFRYTAKVSPHVLPFFKFCFLKPTSPVLCERDLGSYAEGLPRHASDGKIRYYTEMKTTELTNRFSICNRQASTHWLACFLAHLRRYGIKHRIIRLCHPQSNSLAERLNGHIGEYLAQNHFHYQDHMANIVVLSGKISMISEDSRP